MPFTTFVAIDGCPCPVQIADEIREIKRLSEGTLVSMYRGSVGNAPAILWANGKKTQTQLWVMFLNGTGNPANRPGESTHEGFNDGVAYKGPAGMKLEPWQTGMDWDIPHVRAVVDAARTKKWVATVTYPHSSRERQHVNFRKEPVLIVFKSLKKGSLSPRVPSIRRNLAYVLDPGAKKPYLVSGKRAKGSQIYFDDLMYHALREYQRDHGLKDDGIYGYRTAKQLAASVRFRKNKDK